MRWIIGLSLFGIIVVGLVALGASASKNSPDAAKAGDCVKHPGGDEVTVVDCGDPSAAFKVLGRVEGKTKTESTLNPAGICKSYPTTQSAFWRGEVGKPGYVLCLGSVK